MQDAQGGRKGGKPLAAASEPKHHKWPPRASHEKHSAHAARHYPQAAGNATMARHGGSVRFYLTRLMAERSLEEGLGSTSGGNMREETKVTANKGTVSNDVLSKALDEARWITVRRCNITLPWETGVFADIFRNRRHEDQRPILPQDLGEARLNAADAVDEAAKKSSRFDSEAKFKFVLSSSRTWQSSKASVNRIMGFPETVTKRWLCIIWHACLALTAGRKLFQLDETDRCKMLGGKSVPTVKKRALAIGRIFEVVAER